MDPIASTLTQTFKPKSNTNNLESSLAASAKRSLLNTTVIYDSPVKYLGGSLNSLKSKTIILLNPPKKAPDCDNQSGGNEDSKNSPAVLEVPPKPKVVYFSWDAVEVGYNQIRNAGAGMFNMGNTCYLNSTLQALFHTPSLYNYLMSDKHKMQCRNNNGSVQPCMICILTSTLKETLNSKVMRPLKVYEKLKLICKHLVHGRQEDAHEFLRSVNFCQMIVTLFNTVIISCGNFSNPID
jgi:ubiquitin carboxyl-terminal hydrolase 36/42